jgi:multiple sugar transport system permease protein
MKVYQDAFATADIHTAAATAVIIAVVTLMLSFGFLRVAGAGLRQGGSR